MMDMMWIYAIIILTLPEAWGQEPVVRIVSFNQGSDVNLTCSNKTWKDTMFVTWHIKLINKQCMIALLPGTQTVDSCNDGKSLQNTSSFQSYLHITNFSKTDEGAYKCVSPYNGGILETIYDVAVTVPPSVSLWLEHLDNQVVAVCRAERGFPAASITWHYAGKTSTEEILDSNELFTAESRVLLLEGMHPGNLSCVIRHPCWEEERIFFLKMREVPTDPWLYIRIVLVIALILSGFVFSIIMELKRRHQQSDIEPSKS
ncbi:cell surface glycoprotein CD200 receptor 1-B-like isoform X2 [Cheilinus undulatus]|uniref:cell surface glycoprotein CD200 receptor 1-B-like isoform X2 n=1 Tax=Cheilinus undulatus TaxID=241271 RepID=UPI001BD56E16|nr:cell surface glycoprotein CD200 receptor 1-B-like isoform X2 [Cheilinus undulatus]